MEFLDLAAVLFLMAMLAGMIDAIAGGGGLITLPALLWAGLDPLGALATNKLQGVFGTLSATVSFARRGAIDLRANRLTVLCTFAGAALGAILVQRIDSSVLQLLVPLLLIGFAIYFLVSPRVSDLDSRRRIGDKPFALGVGAGVGFYDGFFGPGTGTFFAIGQVALLGSNMRRATAQTKLLNFTSNLASVLVFVAGGHALWGIGLVMACGQWLGAWIGVHLVLRHGTRLIRPAIVAVSLAISLKLVAQQLWGG